MDVDSNEIVATDDDATECCDSENGDGQSKLAGASTEETSAFEILETVILSWTKKKQHEYLKLLNLPVYGNKKEL